MRQAITLLRCAVLFFLIVLLNGCSSGPTLYPVSGKVLYKKSPAIGALIVFHPKGNNTIEAIRPSGAVGADGTYILSSIAGQPGAPAGEYEIAISWDQAPTAAAGKLTMGGDEKKSSVDRFGGKYADPTKSGLKATVKAGVNEIPTIELE